MNEHRSELEALIAAANTVILGKEHQIRLALSCLLAGGDLLIEDLPGVGKTTLAQVLARLCGLQMRRIQFTADLLPADILGASVYDREEGTLRFRPGPIFAQLVLADEVNRATPKAQSALLEAMEERQVTVEGASYRLPQPFFVIATQNPDQQIGCFPLPESQLDRFLMCIGLGYPHAAAERALLLGENRRRMLQRLEPVLDPATLRALQEAATEVHTSAALVDYLQALLQYTRTGGRFLHGLSPRSGLALRRAAQAWALLHGRDHALPEDIQAVFSSVAAHRLQPREGAGQAAVETEAVLERVPIP